MGSNSALGSGAAQFSPVRLPQAPELAGLCGARAAPWWPGAGPSEASEPAAAGAPHKRVGYDCWPPLAPLNPESIPEGCQRRGVCFLKGRRGCREDALWSERGARVGWPSGRESIPTSCVSKVFHAPKAGRDNYISGLRSEELIMLRTLPPPEVERRPGGLSEKGPIIRTHLWGGSCSRSFPRSPGKKFQNRPFSWPGGGGGCS